MDTAQNCTGYRERGWQGYTGIARKGTGGARSGALDGGEASEGGGRHGERGALVQAVGSIADLGVRMHLNSADLDLHRSPAGQRHGVVERAVAVALGGSDVVLAPPVDRRPERVRGGEHAVAVSSSPS